jgi:hypothetical protein
MDYKTFNKQEKFTAPTVTDELNKIMAANGAEEKRLAIAKGHVRNGIPSITVKVDGMYSKRYRRYQWPKQFSKFLSFCKYCYSFSVVHFLFFFKYPVFPCRVAIFGLETNKLLWLEDMNLDCKICTRDRKKNGVRKHDCVKSRQKNEMKIDLIVKVNELYVKYCISTH